MYAIGCSGSVILSTRHMLKSLKVKQPNWLSFKARLVGGVEKWEDINEEGIEK